ncbi:hypothetical protein BS78_K079300 [Paspalum vaginatum]|uniref:AAA+ ATPase domain-containing protein n=1 Tax=Paspalum vaginatum TaxID=158149 RepID=A0A9W8CE89_9POAL|nr:hypothetical protein BS78_K079300 [Paspalum vaginatum]
MARAAEDETIVDVVVELEARVRSLRERINLLLRPDTSDYARCCLTLVQSEMTDELHRRVYGNCGRVLAHVDAIVTILIGTTAAGIILVFSQAPCPDWSSSLVPCRRWRRLDCLLASTAMHSSWSVGSGPGASSLGEGSRLRVMAIVGPAGIGKTTLARQLLRNLLDRGIAKTDVGVELRSLLGTELHLDDDIIGELDPATRGEGRSYYFEYDIMAQVSRRTDRNELLLRHILSQISDEPPAEAPPPSLPFHHQSQPDKTVELLVRLVSERLRNQRYLITIDDLHQASDWEEIKGAFPDCNVGSRILITTRLRSTARAACFSAGSCDGLVHEMKPLSQIMHQQQEAEGEEHQRFESYCKLEQVLHGRFGQELSSAFNDLPEGLRLPSLYLSMFPSGYKLDKDRLIRKWMCDGLCSYDDDTSEAEALADAEAFFSQLVDRNVITSCVCVPEAADWKEGQTRQWHVNHFMHQFLASKAAEIGFALNLVASASPRGHGNEAASRTLCRRLALHHPDPNIASLLEAMDFSQTRSLAVSGSVNGMIPLDKFVNLLVLDLEGWENFMDEDLLQLCTSKMLFLRYLSIRNTRVSKIPLEMDELKMLQALDASYTQISELPIQVLEGLTHLQHLDIRGTRITELPKQTVDLWYLTTLLIGDEGTITNTIEETAAVVVLPYKVETLATVDLTQQPASFVRDLGDLDELKVLAVIWSFQQSTDRNCCKALLSSIQKWESLKSLTIHCELGCFMEFLGAKMDRPPTYLEKFKGTDDLEILRGLPKLQTLILGLDFIPREAVVIENVGFRELQRLCVDCPMPWFTFTQGALEKLRCLQLKFCATPARENAPASQQTRLPSGIGNLCRITEVALCYNAHYINAPSVKMTVKAVSKQVACHPNPIELYINGIEYDEVELLRNVILHDKVKAADIIFSDDYKKEPLQGSQAEV